MTARTATVPLSHALGTGQWDTPSQQRDTPWDSQWDTGRKAKAAIGFEWDTAWDTSWDSNDFRCPTVPASARGVGTANRRGAETVSVELRNASREEFPDQYARAREDKDTDGKA